jgi:membrane protease YdiL (CAAX protease family)
MDNETLPASQASPGAADRLRPSRPPLDTVFHNDNGLRAGWRIVIYFVMVILLGMVANFTLGRILHFPKTNTPGPGQMFVQEAMSFLIVFLPACVMSKLEWRSVGVYGLPIGLALGKRFWQGFLLGLAEIAVLIGCIAAFGGYSFGSLDLHGTTLLAWGMYWLVFFIVVGLFEEFTFRGYLQFTLADGIGFWPAACILSFGFGAVHLFNQGEGLVGAASVVTIGLILALTLKRTGNLWFVVGWHAAFDFGETYLFSVPNSGNVFPGHLSAASLHGAKWLTGGTVGPEGSVFSFLGMAAVALLIVKLFPAARAADSLPATNSDSTIAQV